MMTRWDRDEGGLMMTREWQADEAGRERVEEFSHDVFLSHSSRDKAVVRELAQRLKGDGVRVWFDEWEIGVGQSIPVRINEGLQGSRVLVLVMSQHAFGSEWATLETQSLLFQDPLNRQRRFFPLRLDDTPAPLSLAHFAYADWRGEKREDAYRQLLGAHRAAFRATLAFASESSTQVKLQAKQVSLQYPGPALSVAWSRDGRRMLSGSDDKTLRLWDLSTGECLRVFERHESFVSVVAWSPDGKLALTNDHESMRLWDVENGRLVGLFNSIQMFDFPVCFTWRHDGYRAVSGTALGHLVVWQINPPLPMASLSGHGGSVICVAWSPDGGFVLSGANDCTLRLWDVSGERCLRIFEGHSKAVRCVAWSADCRLAISGADDFTLRLWDVDRGYCVREFVGHSSSVQTVAWSPDGLFLLSGTDDGTVRLWEVRTGRCLNDFRGASSHIRSVVWSANGEFGITAAINGLIQWWDLREFVSSEAIAKRQSESSNPNTKSANPPTLTEDDQLQYTNSKVLLVGDSSAGKTGLSNRLVHKQWLETPGSTVGAWSTQWAVESPNKVDRESWIDRNALPVASTDGVHREIWLWDFGGQADQRLIHQLYMENTALAVLVFDGGKPHLFESLGQWDRDLCKASSTPFQKLLVAGRTDASVVRVDREQLLKFARQRGFRTPILETSAKTGAGCEELRQAIYDAIPWDTLTTRTTLVIFKRLKDEIVALKDEGRVLMRFKELREALTLRLLIVAFRSAKGRLGSTNGTIATEDAKGNETAEDVLAGESNLWERPFAERKATFSDEQLSAVLTLLEGPGVVWELGFGSWVLLQPERINACAQAVIQTMSNDPHGLGCIAEEQVLNGPLKYSDDVPQLDWDEERIVRMAMHGALIDRNLCWREQDASRKTLLVFPSYYRRNRPDPVSFPAVFVSYQFSGFLDDIYATLVVRLHHTDAFERDELWNYAADFKTQTGQQLGVKMTRLSEGAGELDVYFDPAIPTDLKLLFAKFVHEHLKTKVKDIDEIKRLRHYVCPHCHTPVENRSVAMKKLAEGKKTIVCVNCEKRVPLWDELEDRFASDDLREAVRREEQFIEFAKDNESKERLLVGEVISTVALAGQICREISVSDHGIDMEIEFKNDNGDATGKKVLLQLKSGDSHLKHRHRDDVDVFAIKEPRHVEYWMAQAHPVLLVVRNSKGLIRWMEISSHLREVTENGKKTVTQIAFTGERFDVMSVRRWRDRVLTGE